MIYFEIDGEGYAIDTAELAGVAIACPYASYPGLPPGVSGIVQWSGRIFPVLKPFKSENDDLADHTFLFSGMGDEQSPFSEVAVAVPGSVRAWFAREVEPGLLQDDDGNQARKVSVAELAAELLLGKGGQRAA